MSARLEARGLNAAGRLAPTDLRLAPGLTLLVGPNGAGKTSLLHGLAGIGDIAGEVLIDGAPLAAMSPAERVGRFAFLPATRELRWPLAARDLVALGLAPARDPAAVEAALALVEAGDLADRRADRLSTGERARVLIARALVARPDILLLDEPVANLDPHWQLAIMALLRAEATRGATILASLHDLAMARNFADRVLVIDHGRIIADGPPDEALSDARAARIFGVRWTPHGWERAA